MTDRPSRTVRALAVCADDFGMDPQVNAGSLLLAGLGRLSAIACMVGAPFWRSGAHELRHLDAARVQSGLHLDLTEHPLHARMQRPLGEWILRSHARAVNRNELRREVDAQLDAFAGEMNRPPDFVDGHEYVHQLPVVRDVLVEALTARAWRPWLRSTRRPEALHSPRARIIEALGASGLARHAQAHGLRQNRRLLGIYGFNGNGAAYLCRLRQWVSLANDGDLLVCHPAARSANSAAFPAARCHEYAVLSGVEAGALLELYAVRIAPLFEPR